MTTRTELGEYTRTVNGKTYRFTAYRAAGMIYVEGRGDKQPTGDGEPVDFFVNSLIDQLLARGKLQPEAAQ